MSSRPRTSFPALANPSFRSFTIATGLWLMADNIEHVISYWVIFEKFDSPVLGGVAVISHWVPFLFFGGLMGALADRFDLRKLFIISMVMFMGVSLGWAYLFATDTTQIWHAVVLLIIHGMAGAIFTPGSQVMIHDLVRDEHLPSAVRLTATSRQIGLVLGPAVGGGLLLLLGPAAGIAVNALIYVPMVWWSLREKYTGHGDTTAEERRKKPLRLGLGGLIQSYREASQNRTILSMIVLVGLTSLIVGNAFQAQMPEFAEAFGANEGVVYTVLLLAGAIGAIFGGLIQESFRSLSPSPMKATVIALLWTLAILGFAVAPHYLLAIAALFLAGGLLISFSSMAQALVQMEAPAERRGSIIGLFNVSINGLRTGSGLTVGFLGAVIGIHGSLALCAAVLALLLLPLIRYIRLSRDETASRVPAPAVAGSEHLGGCC